MSTNSVETEIKIKLLPEDSFPALLLEKGYVVATGRVFESNVIFDSPDLQMRNRGTTLRVRSVGGRGLVTWKGPRMPGPHKARTELESAVDDPVRMTEILEALGYKPQFRYEKYRTEFRFPASDQGGVITYDETPIGRYLELEGDSAWIDSTAASMGFEPKRYVLESYGSLYAAYCQSRGIRPTNMVFDSAL